MKPDVTHLPLNRIHISRHWRKTDFALYWSTKIGARTMKKLIAGIPAEHWTLFFRLHAEARDAEQILARLRTELMREESELSRESVQQITEAVRQIVDLFK